MRYTILRLGHRVFRDKRITTHVGLTARMFGADGMLLASDDKSIETTINAVTEKWGGSFFIKNIKNWKKEIKNWKQKEGKVLHLTMYGINLPDIIDEIKNTESLLIVVGAEKVPPEIYELSDWNIAIGNQPHSEVAALAVLLDRLNLVSGKDCLKSNFSNAKLKIIPNNLHKQVKEL